MSADRPGGEDFLPLIHRHYTPLYRFALGLGNNEAQAADLTQQTFYLWALRGHQLRERGKAKGWLYTTLYREFLRERRRYGRFEELPFPEEVAAPATATGRAVTRLDGAAALHVIGELTEVFRAPLLLFYVEELSYLEIAGNLGIPVGTVMSRLSRGRAELRARLLPTRSSPKKPPASRLVPA